MADQLPIISGTRAINATTTASISLIGRGLSAIQNKETGLALNDLDARYRQARDIYNRITDYGSETRFDSESMLKRGEQLDLFEVNPLQPFYDKLRQLADVYIAFQQLADKGYGKAYFPLATMYWGGQGINKNIDKADNYSHMAFDWCDNLDDTDPEIERDLGWMYQYGRGVEQDYDFAVIYYEMAAEQGYACGQYDLGCMYDKGRGVEQNHEQAVFWYRKAAEQSHAAAQYYLGLKYNLGRGVEQNHEQAVFWYRKAAEQGYSESQNSLGFMEQDDRQAVFWYRKAAAQGAISGQFNLGLMYNQGRGVEQNYEQAVFWYRKAAEQGFAPAQCNLGGMYDRGRGLEQDDKQAVLWYRKAAEQGFAKGQCYLGYMYDTGRGVEQDNEQAVFWYPGIARRPKKVLQKHSII